MKNTTFILFAFSLFLLLSCNSNTVEKEEISTTTFIYDSIIYELPTETADYMYDVISKKQITFCWLSSNVYENEYIFSFPYNDNFFFNKRDSLLFEKTNRFLKIKDKYFPIVTDADRSFSTIVYTI